MRNFVEDYRPKTVDECILPERIKKTFKALLDKEEIPNMILHGPSGTGKTSIAMAFCEELNIDSLFVNCPRDANIEVLRNEITPFASLRSLEHGDKMKVVILDEADGLDPAKVQKSLNGMIEEFKDTCRFIFTCNFPNKILGAIHSRCSNISFNITKEESSKMMKEFAKRTFEILKGEDIKFDQKSVALFIKRNYPDMRTILGDLQLYSNAGPIDSGILTGDIASNRIQELFQIASKKEWGKMRLNWVPDNLDIILGSNSQIFTSMYDHMAKFIDEKDLPQVVLLLNEYSYKHSFVQDQQLNFVSLMTEIIGLVHFK
ncbi:MAG: AAA family ATPase [Candidatus Izemoplasma sp.]